jgi:hypothetical protein
MPIPFERRISTHFTGWVGGSIDYITGTEIDKYPSAEYVYVLKDVFTTRDGNWTPNNELGSVPQWAVDTYMLPWGLDHTLQTECGSVHETNHYDAGGDHHINGRVVVYCGDNTFKPLRGLGVPDKTFVIENPALTADNGAILRTTKDKQLWMNETQWPKNVYTYYPFGLADKIKGVKMPNDHHVSTFAVWVQVPRATYLSWVNAPVAAKPPVVNYDTLLEYLADEAQRKQVIQFNPNAAIQKVIFADGYVPNSGEFVITWGNTDYVAQRAEHLKTGDVRVYYVEKGKWDIVDYVRGKQ